MTRYDWAKFFEPILNELFGKDYQKHEEKKKEKDNG